MLKPLQYPVESARWVILLRALHLHYAPSSQNLSLKQRTPRGRDAKGRESRQSTEKYRRLDDPGDCAGSDCRYSGNGTGFCAATISCSLRSVQVMSIPIQALGREARRSFIHSWQVQLGLNVRSQQRSRPLLHPHSPPCHEQHPCPITTSMSVLTAAQTSESLLGAGWLCWSPSEPGTDRMVISPIIADTVKGKRM